MKAARYVSTRLYFLCIDNQCRDPPGPEALAGWLIAGINSILICDIAVNTAQLGFIPANVFCVALYAYNIVGWRKQIKMHRLDRMSPGIDSRVGPEQVDHQCDSASPLPNKQRVLIQRFDVAELRLETLCCERSIPSFPDGHERSAYKHVDLRNLLSCPLNPQMVGCP